MKGNPVETFERHKRHVNLEKGIQIFERIKEKCMGTELSKTDYKELTKAAATHWEEGRYHAAIEEYTRLIELTAIETEATKLAILYYDRGTCYSESSDYENAIVDLTRAIEMAPNYAAAYNNRANAYRGLKKFDKALADYNQSIGINPNDGAARLSRATMYCKLGQKTKAIADFYRGMYLEPKKGIPLFLMIFGYPLYQISLYLWEHFLK